MFIEDDTTSRETSRGARIMSMGKALVHILVFRKWNIGV